MKSEVFGVPIVSLVLALAAGPVSAQNQGTPDAGTPDADAGSTSALTEVIVTGTRQTGLRAIDSAAPIEIVGRDTLTHVGQPDLLQAMAQTVPSFNAQTYGFDTANLTLAAALRGLNPNDTLVLVNGKRRHPTGNLQVDSSNFQGADPADLGLIPVAAIDHVEILEDGASALYGTDAIAGVVNIILKSAAQGGEASATGGQYYANGGQTGAASVNFGLPLGSGGFVNVTAEHRYHDFSYPAGADSRVFNANGSLVPGVPAAWASLPDAPEVNRTGGDAASNITNLFVNAGYHFDDVEAYGFASYSHRTASSYANYRLPNRVVASTTLGVAGTYGAPDALVFAPDGFSPREALHEDDFAVTGGLKGRIAGWAWDLSTTYGADTDDIYTLDSANASLFVDTHASPMDFSDGAFKTTQWTNNLDLTHDIDVGFSAPLNVAVGAEERRDTYGITAGDAASIYEEGAQAYPGFQPTDAANHSRSDSAVYVDLAANPVKNLSVDLAGRYEHYSDFGGAPIGRITARYDVVPAFALRSTISTGFRAPTLAEEFYSATNVAPTFAVVQLPSNSPAAKLLGFGNLKPENSNNYSVGFVAHPLNALTVTLDAYQIDIDRRIVATGTILGQNGSEVVSQAVLDAIALHGNVLDPTVSYAGVSVFTNGADTRTRGAELSSTYPVLLGSGRLDLSFTANFNETTVTEAAAPPAVISGQGALLSPRALSDLTTAAPRFKLAFAALYSAGPWSVNVRETLYGPESQTVSPDGTGSGPDAYVERISTTPITDLEVGYAVTRQLKVAVGADNLFDVKPPTIPVGPDGIVDGSNLYGAPMPFAAFGINGGYYYGRVVFSF